MGTALDIVWTVLTGLAVGVVVGGPWVVFVLMSLRDEQSGGPLQVPPGII